MAKLKMLEFYYDFLDKYLDRRDFELIQMDTDINYMAISGENLDELVRPEMKAEYEAEKKNWLAWDKWSSRTPSLQTGERGQQDDRNLLKVLLHRRGRKKEVQHERGVEEAKRDHLAAFQGSFRRRQGQGGKQRF